MLHDSTLEILKAAASDKIAVNDPYEAATWAICVTYQRDIGTLEFIAPARVTKCFSPEPAERSPGKLNENEPDRDTFTPYSFGGFTSSCGFFVA
jgi:hypothetical protein